jgi:hypothetical protein
MVLGVLIGWLDRREREAIAYLIEENRVRTRNSIGTSMNLRWRVIKVASTRLQNPERQVRHLLWTTEALCGCTTAGLRARTVR